MLRYSGSGAEGQWVTRDRRGRGVVGGHMGGLMGLAWVGFVLLITGFFVGMVRGLEELRHP